MHRKTDVHTCNQYHRYCCLLCAVGTTPPLPQIHRRRLHLTARCNLCTWQYIQSLYSNVLTLSISPARGRSFNACDVNYTQRVHKSVTLPASTYRLCAHQPTSPCIWCKASSKQLRVPLTVFATGVCTAALATKIISASSSSTQNLMFARVQSCGVRSQTVDSRPGLKHHTVVVHTHR